MTTVTALFRLMETWRIPAAALAILLLLLILWEVALLLGFHVGVRREGPSRTER